MPMNRRAWIPNALTLGNLTAGFVSVILSGSGTPEGVRVAAILILVAALLDGLDGQTARLLKVDSLIGKELDSLADCVAFGVAPACLAYRVYLSGFPVAIAGSRIDLGTLLVAVFPVCAAYRLARFNVKSSPHSFSGLPSPVAGVLVALTILTLPGIPLPRAVFAVAYCAVAVLMVSTISYSKPQSTIFKGRSVFRLVLLAVVVVMLLVFFRFWVLLLAISAYALSGLLGWLIQFIEERKY
jgi:CDP-diacylglycerol--serine O-phosphatidyltransferase